MLRVRNLLLFGLLVIALTSLLMPEDQAIGVSKPIKLFDGRDLSNFYTWLVDYKFKDPDLVFTVVDQMDGAPAIRISGQHYGGLITKKRCRNYRLIAEFRWGPVTWGDRKDKARDSGILLHCQGPEGNTSRDFSGPWMRSIEFQIIEGGTGDILLVNGYAPAGDLLNPRLTATVGKDRDGEDVYDPEKRPVAFQGSVRINWYGRDPDWSDTLGFRGKHDVESPNSQWTKLEAICEGEKITYIVNGKVVNAGMHSNLTGGKILLQSEGAEIFFRRIDLEPLTNS